MSDIFPMKYDSFYHMSKETHIEPLTIMDGCEMDHKKFCSTTNYHYFSKLMQSQN